MLTVLDLFSGIGGFSLGFERAGMKTIAFVEKNKFCRRVLAKHWPGVPIYEDIKTFPFKRADIITAGFPCQDVSCAGKRAGLAGSRSGLFWEVLRTVSVVRPKYVVLENVPGLLSRGMGEVLGAISCLGYDAEWHSISAAEVGAPHLRNRLWIVAYPAREQRHGSRDGQSAGWDQSSNSRDPVSDANRPRLAVRQSYATNPYARPTSLRNPWWPAEPAVDRVVDGFPGRVDQIRALGNSLVPQIAEIIARAILNYEREQRP